MHRRLYVRLRGASSFSLIFSSNIALLTALVAYDIATVIRGIAIQRRASAVAIAPIRITRGGLTSS
jgi:hypothetical protein